MIESQTFQHLIQLLTHIGFREKESLVYITLLAMGPSVITNVARSIQLPRSSTHHIITDLLKRGVLRQKPSSPANQQKYEAMPPSVFLKYLYTRRGRIDRQIRSLQETLEKLEPSNTSA